MAPNVHFPRFGLNSSVNGHPVVGLATLLSPCIVVLPSCGWVFQNELNTKHGSDSETTF